MKCKFVFVSLFIAIFTLKAHSRRHACFLHEFQNEPRVIFTWKSKCSKFAAIYACRGGFKFDAASLKDWKKDTENKNEVYDFIPVITKNVGYDFGDTIDAVLEKSCPSGCYGSPETGFGISKIDTCAPAGEQPIYFNVGTPTGARGAWTYCNAEGGTALLKEHYPKAKWEHHPVLPHTYYYEAKSTGEMDRLHDAFIETREKTKGCQLRSNLD